MKTITEFSGFQVAAALKTMAELSAAGKTPEEVAKAMGDAYKVEGDKLKLFTDALEMAKGRPENLKRIVVLTLNEGEKAPDKTQERDGKHFLMEFFYVPSAKPRGRERGRGERGEGRGDRGGKRGKGRRGERGEGRRDGAPREGAPRGDRRDRRPRDGGERMPQVTVIGPSGEIKSAEGSGPKRERRPRAERPPVIRVKQDVSVEKQADGSYQIKFKPLADAPATPTQTSTNQ